MKNAWKLFLVACARLYNLPCPSVGWSVGRLVGWFVILELKRGKMRISLPVHLFVTDGCVSGFVLVCVTVLSCVWLCIRRVSGLVRCQLSWLTAFCVKFRKWVDWEKENDYQMHGRVLVLIHLCSSLIWFQKLTPRVQIVQLSLFSWWDSRCSSVRSLNFRTA